MLDQDPCPRILEPDCKFDAATRFESRSMLSSIPITNSVMGVCPQAKAGGFVARTLNRSLLWEMQTPQVIQPDLLRRGFEHVRRWAGRKLVTSRHARRSRSADCVWGLMENGSVSAGSVAPACK